MMIDSISGLSNQGVIGLRPPTGTAAAAMPEMAVTSTANADFTAMLGTAITGFAQQLRQAEAVSIAGVKGAASTQDMVEQVMAAEQTLQASIAVRDKIVAAYLEISRMAI